MAPRLSLLQFNRHIAIYKRFLVSVEPSVNQLSTLPPSQCRSSVDYLSKSIAAELKDFEATLSPYLSSESLCEGLEEDALLNAYSEVKAGFHQLLAAVVRYTPVPLASSTALPEVSMNAGNLNVSNLTLPPLKLNKFSGTYSEFDNWYVRFDTLVHSCTQLSTCEKFEYLLCHLEGPALDVVKIFPFNEDNYLSALKALKDRFSNKRRVISIHSNNILGLSTVTNEVTSIRSFLDSFNANYTSLQNILKAHQNVDPEHSVFVQFILSKLPSEIRDEFEHKVAKTELITISHVIDFLTDHVKAMENACIECTSPTPSSSSSCKSKPLKGRSRGSGRNSSVNKTLTTLSASVAGLGCFICSSSEHKIVNCSSFLNLSPRERYDLVKQRKLCVKCLMPTHSNKCKHFNGCDKCNSRGHNSILHFSTESEASKNVPPVGNTLVTNECAREACVVAQPKVMTVLMSTALVRLQIAPTRFVIARAILDSASHVSFISEHIAQTLECQRTADSSIISGIGCSSTPVKGQCVLSVANISGKIVASDHKMLILPNITLNSPRENISSDVLEAAKCFALADPTFHVPSRVDVLLGADIVAASLIGPVTSLGDDMPVVMLTLFGAVLMGKAPVAPTASALAATQSCSPKVTLVTSNDGLVEVVQKFWAIDEAPKIKHLSPEERLCEQFFNKTVTRLGSGRYQVRLPFIENGRDKLGQSYSMALSRLRSLERKFRSDSNFKDLYVKFMADYRARGHMVRIDDTSFPKFFIPHHGVYKSHGDTSRIRVVFNASAESSNSVSLNSVLFRTPNVLNLLNDVLTLFRLCAVAFTSDIEMMYRQIRLHEDDWPFQCILWREDESQPVSIYALCTLVYGVGPSGYLAIATLRKLATDFGHMFPRAARLLIRRMFVDDIGAGANTVDLALQLRDELIALLREGGFVLKKWASNAPKLLNDIPSSDCLPADCTRVLGLVWDVNLDVLKFPVQEMILPLDGPVTKRTVLTQTAKLYDPCGFISPLIVKAKCFFQKLWRSSLDWDTPLSVELRNEWLSFQRSLFELESFSIPRHLGGLTSVQIHGFCDASQQAYAAVLYLRSCCSDQPVVNLIASRTKVAPMRPFTIPRLEMLGAHLLAKLYNHYFELLSSEYHIKDVFLWSDSSIVLDWLKIDPYNLKTFVANRVAQVTEWTSAESWRHVPGSLNPADIASRGVTSPLALDSPLWKFGPPFLKLSPSSWPSNHNYSRSYKSEDLELKQPCVALTSSAPQQELLEHFSSWSRVSRIVLIIARWLLRIQKYRKTRDCSSLVVQYKKALSLIANHVQGCAFRDDIVAIQNGRLPRPAIQRLAPFIDEDGTLRIKGRLTNSSLASRPCPILLPKHHHLVHLLIEHYHVALGHAGPSQVQFQISWTYWILSARQVIRQIIHRCVTCFRASPRPSFPLMGDLPAVRVNPSPPFWHTGMDFCGPFLVKPYALRKAPVIKVYLCVFICLAVKAVHLEVSNDLSTQSFLDVLKRFIARRGIPCRLYSDCGTNFVGARNRLERELKSLLRQHSSDPLIANYLLSNRIEFHTVPPSAPHQGGIWERAVQSAKFHLRRVVGAQVLTLSQLQSLATQIEGVLNSRPLTPMSADPGDYTALTPAHFLIQRPITAPLEEDLTTLGDGSLRHYQLTCALLQRFWRQWHKEYLTTLQARTKWFKKAKNLEVGDVVVVAEPSCPPLSWPLGRICEVYPGADGVVRRVLVKTQGGTYERPSVKVFRLPICVEDSSSN